jgi:hypothetical protein
LSLSSDILVSKLAFKFNLYRYIPSQRQPRSRRRSQSHAIGPLLEELFQEPETEEGVGEDGEGKEEVERRQRQRRRRRRDEVGGAGAR